MLKSINNKIENLKPIFFSKLTRHHTGVVYREFEINDVVISEQVYYNIRTVVSSKLTNIYQVINTKE